MPPHAPADAAHARLRGLIRDVPDFPRPGILFKDITPLLADGPAFGAAIDALAERASPLRPDVLVAIESRGFLFGAALALRLGAGLALVRKPGKLPWKTARVDYALEYGTDRLEMHVDALRAGARCVIIDDVLATGGTAAAARQLVEGQGGQAVGGLFAIELAFLGGRARLGDLPVSALLVYEESG